MKDILYILKQSIMPQTNRDLYSETINKKLPPEILALVFSFLQPKDLGAVSLVSKKWKVIADDEIKRKQYREELCTEMFFQKVLSANFSISLGDASKTDRPVCLNPEQSLLKRDKIINSKKVYYDRFNAFLERFQKLTVSDYSLNKEGIEEGIEMVKVYVEEAPEGLGLKESLIRKARYEIDEVTAQDVKKFFETEIDVQRWAQEDVLRKTLKNTSKLLAVLMNSDLLPQR